MARKFLIFSLFSLVLLGVNSRLDCLEEDSVKLIVGSTHIFSTRAPTRVVIGNPAIADITEVTNTEITLSAKAAGVTNLIYWDAFGEQSVKIRVVAEDMEEIKRRVDNILSKLNLPEVHSKAEDEENKVFLMGRVKTPLERERIMLALGELKTKTVDLVEVKEEQATVDIDVQILELNKGATDTLGITWPGSINLLEKGSPGISTTGTKWSTLFKILNFQRGTSSGTDPFTFKLDLLIREGNARILSRPRLACQSGKEAEMLVGGEKPTFTTSVSTGGTATSTVDYKEYGIKLKIRPTVLEKERIKLGMDVEVSDVGEAVTIGGTSTTGLAYPITKRNVSTELFLNDGQTLAIGGLIKQKSEEDLRKFPWLADIPVLGMFFRQRTTTTGSGYSTKGDTELFITLTPTIVSREGEIKETKKEIEPQLPAVSTQPVAGPTNPVTEYSQIVQRRIMENLVYPAVAKQAGFQGTVKLSLHLSYLGDLMDISVKDSSGYKVLDDHALSAAQSISSYPPFPTTIQQTALWIDVPISYKLN